jgi:hypothetical protein
MYGMRRTTGLLFGWLVVTAAAVALALAAVGLVTHSVTENRPASLSASAVADALKASLKGTTGPTTTTTTATTALTGSTTPTTAGPTTTTRPEPRSTTTRPVPTAAVTRPATTPTTSKPTDEHDDTSPPPAPARAEDRTYNLVGGSAAVRFEGGRARLLWATPRPGFRLESSGDEDQVDILFLSDGHESRLRAYWDNGPKAEVEEKQD